MSAVTAAEVVIVGGGLIGSAVARELALRGREVVLFDDGAERFFWCRTCTSPPFVAVE